MFAFLGCIACCIYILVMVSKEKPEIGRNFLIGTGIVIGLCIINLLTTNIFIGVGFPRYKAEAITNIIYSFLMLLGICGLFLYLFINKDKFKEEEIKYLKEIRRKALEESDELEKK